MSILTFLGISLLIFLGAMSPGPDFAVVSRNTLTGSRRSGVYTALGITLAIYIHTNYCVWGLAIIIAHSPWLFNTIKYLGAAYLIYIGLKGLWSQSKPNHRLNKKNPWKNLNHSTDHSKNKSNTQLTDLQAFRQGFLTCMLNPKATLFFLSLFTVVIRPDSSMGLTLHLLLPIDASLITFIWFALLSIMLSSSPIKNKLEKVQVMIVKLLSIFLIILGVTLCIIHMPQP